ncbi:MAG: response regulator [Burkholderiales bacterium]
MGDARQVCPPERRLIAILDDEPDVRLALSRLLQAHGYEVAQFADGHLLLAAMASRTFECVVLDLNMPAMSGFEVLAELRTMPRRPPVILLTGHEDPSYAWRALALDAFAFHRKPVRAPELLTAIERACHFRPIGAMPSAP